MNNDPRGEPRPIAVERLMTEEERAEWLRERIAEAESALACAELEAREALEDARAMTPPTVHVDYVDLYPGDPGYEDATYEKTGIVVRRTNCFLPWAELLKSGTHASLAATERAFGE